MIEVPPGRQSPSRRAVRGRICLVGITLVLLALAACGEDTDQQPASNQDTPPADTPASPIEPVDEVTSSSSTSPSLMLADTGTFEATDTDGFVTQIDYEIASIDGWAIDPTNSLPGETQATLDITTVVSALNLTGQRESPTPGMSLRLIYAADSLVCQAAEQMGSALTFLSTSFCYVEVRESLWDENSAMPSPTLAPEEALTIERTGVDESFGGDYISAITLPDDGDDAALSALNAPEAFAVTVSERWTVPDACTPTYYPDGNLDNPYGPTEIAFVMSDPTTCAIMIDGNSEGDCEFARFSGHDRDFVSRFEMVLGDGSPCPDEFILIEQVPGEAIEEAVTEENPSGMTIVDPGRVVARTSDGETLWTWSPTDGSCYVADFPASESIYAPVEGDEEITIGCYEWFQDAQVNATLDALTGEQQ